MARQVLLGVDLGGTKVAVSLWAERSGGEAVQLGKARWPTHASADDNLARIVAESRALMAAAGSTESGAIAAIGVSGGGPVDPERGVLLTVPNLPGWRDVPVCDVLAGALGAPAAMENDANACALAEWSFGAGRGCRHLAFLTCSTGIGAGLILDGRLYRGHGDLAGEIGHLTIEPGGAACGCGRRGCLEAYASGVGMARRLAESRRENEPFPTTAKGVTELARGGDRGARDFLAETGRYLARGLAPLIFLLNPERIVLGTIAVGAGDLLLEPLRQELRRLVWPAFLAALEVVPAALGEGLGDHAALAVARRKQGRES